MTNKKKHSEFVDCTSMSVGFVGLSKMDFLIVIGMLSHQINIILLS